MDNPNEAAPEEGQATEHVESATKEEVKADYLNEMHTSMLEMNIPMPLSSFSKVGDKYVIFGALSINSSFHDIEHELGVLSNNAIEIIDDMGEYLI